MVFLDVTLFLFQTDIVHFHFELKKRLEKMDSLLYYKLYCTWCISSRKKNIKNKMTYILMISDEKYEVNDVNEMDRYRESGNIN